MATIVTMHQPNYLPWPGLFSKIKQSDLFVITDTFELGTESLTNRNKIRTNTGWGYITIPIGRSIHGTRICDITLPQESDWKKLHWTLIHHNYAKAKFFDLYQDFFRHLYETDYKYLCHINIDVIKYLLKCFNIEIPMLKASDMDIDSSLQKTDLMIALLKKAGADIYLSGPSGRNYLEIEKFSQNNIGLKFFKYSPPIYEQRFPGFETNMSAIDLLFNVGPQACEVITDSGEIED